MKKTKEMKNKPVKRFNAWIRAIALILVITFVWQSVVWANPDVFSLPCRQAGARSTLGVPSAFQSLALRERLIAVLIAKKCSASSVTITQIKETRTMNAAKLL